MRILCKQISKKFGKQIILKNFSQELSSEKTYVVTGANGSGKSTFLKLLAGTDHSDKGEILYFDSNNNKILPSDIYQQLTIAAPYLELIEELSLAEHIRFHKSMDPGFDCSDEVFKLAKLDAHFNKKISDFSSGMKQRVKLILAFFSARNILFLDEPTSNLDIDGKDFYKKLLTKETKKRLVVIFTNEPDDYNFLTSYEIISL